jgi:PPOX class probable F420-dependent enzyme
MEAARWRELLAAARVGRLATVRPDGRPHVVVCCFALHGSRVWTAVDAKPKATVRLQRLANVRAHPWASLLVDHYDEDWGALWWVRVDGPAAVLDGGDERDEAIAALVAKYEQYAAAPPDGPVIALVAERISGWSARPRAR